MEEEWFWQMIMALENLRSPRRSLCVIILNILLITVMAKDSNPKCQALDKSQEMPEQIWEPPKLCLWNYFENEVISEDLFGSFLLHHGLTSMIFSVCFLFHISMNWRYFASRATHGKSSGLVVSKERMFKLKWQQTANH